MQETKRCGFSLWVRKTAWRRKWHPTPVFLPGKFHGQRSLEACSPWGCKELDMTEHAHVRVYWPIKIYICILKWVLVLLIADRQSRFFIIIRGVLRKRNGVFFDDIKFQWYRIYWLCETLNKKSLWNTCIPVADSFWYLAKLIQLCKN